MKHLILGLSFFFLMFSAHASDSLVQQESRVFRVTTPITLLQTDSLIQNPLLRGFSSLKFDVVRNSYQLNSYLTDSLITADSTEANFWNKMFYGVKNGFHLAKSDTSYAMALSAPIALAVFLLILIPVFVKLFFFRVSLSNPVVPSNFEEDDEEESQLEEEIESDSQNTKNPES